MDRARVERAREEGKRGTEKSAGVHGQKHEESRVPISPGARNVSQKRVEADYSGKKGHCVFSLSRRTRIHGCFRFAFATKFVTKKIQ